MKNSEEMKTLILAGKFLETRELVKTINKQELEELLFALGTEKNSFCSYTYVCFFITDNRNSRIPQPRSTVINNVIF